MRKIVLPLRPVPQRDSAVSRRGFAYITTKDRARIELFNRAILDAHPDKIPFLPDQGIAVFYELVFRVPSSLSKANREKHLNGQVLRTVVPDRVNCEDFLDNRLKDTIIEDDRFIVFGGSIKRYGEIDETIIYLEVITGYNEIGSFVREILSLVTP